MSIYSYAHMIICVFIIVLLASSFLFRLESTKLLEGECTLVPTTSIKRLVCITQAVPREYQLTFGCTRLQELEYFCMPQSTQQFLIPCM
jgi:hypothetical protein